MSISPTNPTNTVANVVSAEVANAPQKNQTAPAKGSYTPSVSANVKLSPASKVLLASQDNDVNMSKVEALKQAIASGELVVDSQKIANNLVKITIREVSKQ